MIIETYKTCKNCDYFVNVGGSTTICIAHRIMIDLEEDDPRSCYLWAWDKRHDRYGETCDDLHAYAEMVRGIEETPEEDDPRE